MKIEILKQSIDILEVVESYAPLKKSGGQYLVQENPLREERTPSLRIYPDTQSWYDFGSGEGGDVIDFIKKIESIETKDAVNFLEDNFLGSSDNSNMLRPAQPHKTKPAKDNDFLQLKVARKAKHYLASSHQKYTSNYGVMTLDIDGAINEVVRVSPVFEKLFEGYMIPTDRKFADYLFSRVIGYDSYFDCPVIVLRDEDEKAVDIVRYKPQREGKLLEMKYLYLRNTDKPDSNYLFPLQAQMQKIMMSSGYTYVGEGLKNAINASILGIPFVSTESASSIKPELISFLNSDRMKNIVMVGAFDGDSAGKRAYEKLNKEVSILNNKFDFNSGIDFSDYLREIKNDKTNNR